MKNKSAVVWVAVFASICVSNSQMYTYGEIPDIRYRWDGATGSYVYDSILVTSEIARPKLNSVSLSLQSRGSYLDVTEDAILSPSIASDGQTQPPYYMQGTVHLPKGSSIISFYVSSDTTGYSAKVLPEFPLGFEVDTTMGENIASLKFKNQTWGLSADQDWYELSLNSIQPGKIYNVRIRYLTPNAGGSSALYTMNILNHSLEGNPRYFELKYLGSVENAAHSLEIGGLTYPLGENQSIQVPYNSTFQIRTVESTISKFHTTQFSEGPWMGKYLILNTTIPDSVLSSMSQPIETVFLWRWNRPSSFVNRYRYYDYSSLSNYGQQAVSQASAIREMVKYLVTLGNQTGMVHSIQYKKPEVFPLCKAKSSAFARLDGYLSQFTEDYFLNSGYFEYDTEPDDPIPTGPVDSSKAEFKSCLNEVHGLYSDGNGVLKHLVIISAGPVQISRDLISIEEIDSLVNDLSVDCQNAVWRDISFNLVSSVSLQKTLVPIGGFSFPEFRPSSIMLQVSSESKTYSFPLSTVQNRFSIMAKSQGSWNSTLTWKGYSKSGEVMGEATSKAAVLNVPQDTGLVKLWASCADRLADKVETDVGLTYGVISEQSSLRIFSTFKGYDSTSTAYASTVPVYWKPTTGAEMLRTAIVKGRCSYSRGMLRISLPGNEKIRRVRIFSLDGKLLAEFDPQHYRTDSGYAISRSVFKQVSGNCMVIVRIQGEKGVSSYRMIM